MNFFAAVAEAFGVLRIQKGKEKGDGGAIVFMVVIVVGLELGSNGCLTTGYSEASVAVDDVS